MRKQEIDYILRAMLDSHEERIGSEHHGGSPFRWRVGGARRRAGHAAHREAHPFPDGDLRAQPDQPGPAADEILLSQGSCDSSYELPGKARFRVNIFSQRGNFSVVLRKLETRFRPSRT